MKKIIAYALASMLVASPVWADSPNDSPATAPTAGNTSNTATSLLKTIMNLLSTINTSATSIGTNTSNTATNTSTTATNTSNTATNTSTTATNTSNTATSVSAINTATGAQSDAAWTSGNGSLIALLKAVANGVLGLAQGSITSGQTGALVQCAVTTSVPTYTTAKTDPLSCDTSGNTRVVDPSTSGIASSATTIATNTGNTATGVGGVADSAYTSGSGSVIAILKGIFARMAALGQTTMSGSMPVAIASNQSAIPVNLAAATTGGGTPAHFLSAATNNSTLIKNSAGTVFKVIVVQTTTTLGDVRLYDTGTTAPTCSSATGVVANFALQSNATSPGLSLDFGANGLAFANSIGICVTGAVADNDNTNFVTGAQVTVVYK